MVQPHRDPQLTIEQLLVFDCDDRPTCCIAGGSPAQHLNMATGRLLPRTESLRSAAIAEILQRMLTGRVTVPRNLTTTPRGLTPGLFEAAGPTALPRVWVALSVPQPPGVSAGGSGSSGDRPSCAKDGNHAPAMLGGT